MFLNETFTPGYIFLNETFTPTCKQKVLAPEAQYTIQVQKKLEKNTRFWAAQLDFYLKKIMRYHWSRISELAIIIYLKITNNKLVEKTDRNIYIQNN